MVTQNSLEIVSCHVFLQTMSGPVEKQEHCWTNSIKAQITFNNKTAGNYVSYYGGVEVRLCVHKGQRLTYGSAQHETSLIKLTLSWLMYGSAVVATERFICLLN